MPVPTSTPEPIETPAPTETPIPTPTLTPTSTPIPTPTSTPVVKFGPASGSLDHDVGREGVPIFDSQTNVADFVTEATFTTPHNIARRGWSSGFLLRETGDGKSHAVLIHKSGEWSHYLGSSNPEDASLVATGSSQNIRTGREAQNHVLVMASGSIGWLFINGVYEAELDFRGLVGSGSIGLVGAWLPGDEFPGFTVPFSDFTVQPLGRKFGPEKGTIEHSPSDEHIDTYPTSVRLADGVIEARFFNPYSSSEGDWTSGLLIRIGSSNEHHAVFIDDDGGWHHYLRLGGADSKLAEGTSEHISTSPSGSNHIRIIALGESGLLFVNGALVSSLDLSGLVRFGNVAGVGAYFSSHAIAGKFTNFEDFTIWSVGTVTRPAPTSTPTPSPATPTTTPTAPPAATSASIATPSPTSTPGSVDTLTPTPSLPSTPIATPTPEATNTPTTTSTPIPTATASTSTQAVGPQPHLKHLGEKQLMLTLINAEREKAGVGSVVLGTNNAAQLHADASLEHCFSSHWGIDGLKPYMRYSLAGGYQSNGENGLGLDYCIKASDWYSAIASTNEEIRDAVDVWMSSTGHKDNILDQWHKKVNIGLAWDRYNFLAVQHFEGDYVSYDRPPGIEEGVLSLSGQVKNGVSLGSPRDLNIGVFYDPSPHSLTRGQLSRTYCYDNGRPIAWLRQRAPAGSFYRENTLTRSYYNRCRSPYKVSPDTPAPTSAEEARALWELSRIHPGEPPQLLTLPWIDASKQIGPGDGFSLEAGLGNLLAEHGAGVYSLIVWGKIGDEDVVISQYSIFHGVTLPDTYAATSP